MDDNLKIKIKEESRKFVNEHFEMPKPDDYLSIEIAMTMGATIAITDYCTQGLTRKTIYNKVKQ